MILLQTLLLLEAVSCSIDGRFDPDLTKLKGLVCYQCKATDKYCHPAKFFASPKKAKLDMLIQCPQDSKYCLKREVQIDHEHYEVDRSCAKAVDSKGQLVRAGCMVVKSMELCLCEENLCNGAKKNAACYFLVLIFIIRTILPLRY